MEEKLYHHSHISKAPSSCSNHEDSNEDIQHKHRNQQEQVNISNTKPFMSLMWDNVWFCIVFLVLFWLIETVTFVVGVHGSDLQLGSYSSHLIEINSMIVQSIKVQQNNKPKPGLMLYGFDNAPPLDVKVNWTEMYDVSIPPKSQKEWIFYLNKDSQLDVFVSVVKSLVAPLVLVIAKGRECIAEWKEDPLSPDATMYWNNIYGSGNVTQKISESSTYYVAIANMNHQNVKVQLKFNVNALLYNTTSSYKRCSLNNSSCRINTALSANIALLTTPGPREGVTTQEWFDVNVSYEPRWIIYFIGTGVMAVIVICALESYQMFQINNERFQFQQVEVISERAPLLSRKDSDLTSWSSSYDSFSSDEENCSEGKSIIEGETSNNDLRCLCVICFDARRDCFFLPCGHFATCYACGTRIAAETCTCPICRRKMRKLRKIYIV